MRLPAPDVSRFRTIATGFEPFGANSVSHPLNLVSLKRANAHS